MYVVLYKDARCRAGVFSDRDEDCAWILRSFGLDALLCVDLHLLIDKLGIGAPLRIGVPRTTPHHPHDVDGSSSIQIGLTLHSDLQ
jgi:hypothetical protein